MDQRARDVLIQILRQYGPAITREPKRLEALLHDLCPELRRESAALMAAARVGMPAELAAAGSGSSLQMVGARWAQRLADDLALAPDACSWCVEVWAQALGLQSSPVRLATRTGVPLPSHAATQLDLAPVSPAGRRRTASVDRQLRALVVIRGVANLDQATALQEAFVAIPEVLSARATAFCDQELTLDVSHADPLDLAYVVRTDFKGLISVEAVLGDSLFLLYRA